MPKSYQDIFDFMINYRKSCDKKYWIEQFKLDLEKTDCCGRTPLHYAAYNNDVELLEILINSGAKINAKDDFGMTALHRAIFWNALDATQLLIKAGADITVIDNYGSTIWHHVVLGRALDTARFLLTQKNCLIMDHVNHDGLTPLDLALNQEKDKPSIAFFSLLDQADCENKYTLKLKKGFNKKNHNINAIIELLKSHTN